MIATDSIRYHTDWRIDRFDAEQTLWVRNKAAKDIRTGFFLGQPDMRHFKRYKVEPYLTTFIDGNLLTTAGLNRLTSLAIAAGGQAMTNTATRIGAGNSATAETVGQTDLQAAAGSTNRWFQIMAATYPQQANGVLTYQSVFGTADGNFAWAEFGIDVAAPTVTSGNTVNALLFNRKVSSQGTKASGQTWTATATITIT